MTHDTATPDTIALSGEVPHFTLSKQQLLARQSFKWRQYPPGVIAACVADMDFRVAPEIQAAIQHGVDAFDYSYPLREGDRADRVVAAAFAARMKEVCAWELDAAQVLVLADLVQATYATILAFSDPGDGVILQVPNYPPFRDAIETCGRRLIPLEMERTEDGHVFDLGKLESAIDERTKIFVLCNPQNPTGRVFTRAELDDLAAFAQRHGLIVVSDEIHSDLVYPGARHLPFAASSPMAAARTVTLNSATKSFNIPGLRCGVAHFGTHDLMKRFHARIPLRLTGSVSSFGIDATVAAWTKGQPWLQAVLKHLRAMRDHVAHTLHHEIPEIHFRLPQATYLLWMDCTNLGLEGSAFDFFFEHARIGFSPGQAFHPAAAKFVRMNFAASRSIVDEVLDRMVTAVRARR